MPKHSVSLERNDFLQYLHLTQSEAARHHNVSLSCFKRYFHQLFRPRIHWSTKKDRIILRKAINYPANNVLTPDLIEKFLSGTLRGENDEEEYTIPHSEINKIESEHVKELEETKALLQDYESKQRLIQQLVTTNSNSTFRGYPEFIDGPWKEDYTWMIPEGKLSISWTGLVVCNHNWDIVACNDMFYLLTGYEFSTMIQGVSWFSLLPPPSNQIARTVFSTVMMQVRYISSTFSLLSRSGNVLKMYVTIFRFAEGYYIYLENNDSYSNVAQLIIDSDELQVPCIESNDTSLDQAFEILLQQIHIIFQYGIMRQQGMEMHNIVPACHNNPWYLPMESMNSIFNF